MIDAIRSAAAASDFDFRKIAHPRDPLSYLFEEWVDYYRMKRAIAAVLKPRSILEIGVRFGYSAYAFLHAVPNARFVGIDNDSQSFGGQSGAVAWARKALRDHDATIHVADTQSMQALPGNWFDLVHIDGQQDGDGTFRDLELALPKARWLLVDGYFWSRENMLAATLFMEKHRTQIAGAYVLPGYAGELLIETRTPEPTAPSADADAPRTHESLRESYDAGYYLSDCGGYDAFRATGGTDLADPRLRAMAYLAEPVEGLRVLDLGCGRGELAYAAYRLGANVVGLDYSRDAIGIARDTYAPHLGERLAFVEADALDWQPPHAFDRILAADVIEHIDPAALARLYARVAQWLAPGGRFIVHTWPSRLAYERQHGMRRLAARRAGLYLPRNPRSRFEDLMHVNEQTPAAMRRTLRRAFPHVALGAGAPLPASPTRGFRAVRATVMGNDHLYAVASNAPIDAHALEASIAQPALSHDAARNLRIELVHAPETVVAGEAATVDVDVRYDGDGTLRSLPPHPVHLAYRWFGDHGVIVADGARTGLVPSLARGRPARYRLRIIVPAGAERLRLVVSAVQEGCFWFVDVDPASGCAALFRIAEPVSENP